MRNRARILRCEMTDAEKRVWEALRRDQCDGLRFRRQEILDQYIADFYCPTLKLVVEIDGTSHDCPEAQRYDTERTQSLFEARGLRVIRLRNEEVLKATPHQIRQAVRRKIAELPPLAP
ncbi:very-short-patch-repair endonuclease [Armatimonas rosea]|uniref:Very-short-patch-repair endonuclease n=2 Tax=Armatimonas rosea TaxID=685828 RepID=A0A7W9SUJ8_ARMRO|nr:endonuclease domain-containing protein [Armatimonas rosea]MBB6052494.1 very-short-patch-repair endonuclease [Armatimonas rosea]